MHGKMSRIHAYSTVQVMVIPNTGMNIWVFGSLGRGESREKSTQTIQEIQSIPSEDGRCLLYFNSFWKSTFIAALTQPRIFSEQKIADFSARPITGEGMRNPLLRGTYRSCILRGASWADFTMENAVSRVDGIGMVERYNFIGFRLFRSQVKS